LNYLIVLAAIIGYFVLLFFPEPQINFWAYLGTALFFIFFIIFLIKSNNKNIKFRRNLIFIFLGILSIFLIGFILFDGKKIKQEEEVLCSEELKVCLNGSFISRKSPDCNFTSSCPQKALIKLKRGVVRINALIDSPLIIEGEARGSWFFEASFPIKLLDQEGEVMATAIAQTQEDWMTEDFVLFESKLEFDLGGQRQGELVFEKDNPSGLSKNDQKVRIPIRFKQNKDLIK